MSLKYGALTISDLSAVPFDGAHLCSADILLGIDIEAHRVALFPHKLINKHLPDLLSLLVGKLRVVQLHVDAQDEGIVKRADPIRYEEQDAVIVFEFTQERWMGLAGDLAVYRMWDMNLRRDRCGLGWLLFVAL